MVEISCGLFNRHNRLIDSDVPLANSSNEIDLKQRFNDFEKEFISKRNLLPKYKTDDIPENPEKILADLERLLDGMTKLLEEWEKEPKLLSEIQLTTRDTTINDHEYPIAIRRMEYEIREKQYKVFEEYAFLSNSIISSHGTNDFKNSLNDEYNELNQKYWIKFTKLISKMMEMKYDRLPSTPEHIQRKSNDLTNILDRTTKMLSAMTWLANKKSYIASNILHANSDKVNDMVYTKQQLLSKSNALFDQEVKLFTQVKKFYFSNKEFREKYDEFFAHHCDARKWEKVYRLSLQTEIFKLINPTIIDFDINDNNKLNKLMKEINDLTNDWDGKLNIIEKSINQIKKEYESIKSHDRTD